jgi:hypothetical protein
MPSARGKVNTQLSENTCEYTSPLLYHKMPLSGGPMPLAWRN